MLDVGRQAEFESLLPCTSYLAENVAGKKAMVVQRKSCVICLHSIHGVDKCQP